jgi:hypothetical protein
MAGCKLQGIVSSTASHPRRTARLAFERAVAPAVIVALVVYLFQDAVFRGRVFFDRDLSVLWFEQVQSFVRTLVNGSWPVWDPFQGFGQPMLANPNRQVFYPLTWLHLLMDPWAQYTTAVVVQSAASAMGVFALTRRLGLSRWAGLLSAGLWVASGPHVSLVNVWNHLSGAVVMPWVLFFTDRLLLEGRRRDVLSLAGVVALQIVAGSPDMTVFTCLLAALLVTWRMARVPGTRTRRTWLSLLAALALAASLSAAQWVPTVAVLQRTVRVSLAPTTSMWSGTAPERLRETLVPLAPCDAGGKEGACTGRDRFLDSIYLGALSLPLLAAALATRRRAAFGLGAVVLLASAWALGTQLPLYGAGLRVLPPLALLRYPEKAFVVVAFASSLLAGLGLDALTADSRTRRRARVLALVASSLLLAGYGLWGIRLSGWPRELLVAGAALLSSALLLSLARLPREVSRACLAVLAVLELAGLTQLVNPTAPRDFVAEPPLVAQLAARDGAARMCVFPYDAALAQRYLGRTRALKYRGIPTGWTEAMAGAYTARELLFPPLGGAFGLHGSFDPDIAGFADRDQARLRHFFAGVAGTAEFQRLLERTGVSHLVTLHLEGLGGLTPVARRVTLIPEPIHLLRVRAPFPRAYVVSAARPVAATDEIAVFAGGGFDPRREVLVTPAAAAAASSPPSVRDLPAFPGVVEIRELNADRVRLRAELERDGYVVLLEAFDPGWSVTVDGAPADIVRANVVFRAVRVPRGTHELAFVYRPRAVLFGLAWSAAALVLMLGLGAALLRTA